MTQASIRKTLRQQRKTISAAAQLIAAHNLTTQLCRLAEFHYSRRIAFYITNDGELNPFQALTIARTAGKKCFLPVLHPLKFNRLHFAQHTDSRPLTRNRFGILEPDLTAQYFVPPWSLDIIFMPLVGFDKHCNRIGMGGGFYDRTLAFKRTSKKTKPLLIGLAHQQQQVDNIQPNSWDIPLDLVVTDQHIFRHTPQQQSDGNRISP